MKKQIKAPAPQEVVDRLCDNLVAGGFSDDGKTRDYALSLITERILFIEGLGGEIRWPTADAETKQAIGAGLQKNPQ